ncbi:MAG: transcriptional regulator [Promethearchaeota archaeon]
MKKKKTQKKDNSPSLPQTLDKIIHEPNRLRILVQLYVVEVADVVYLQQRLGLTWGNLSSHLSKLEKVGYVVTKKEFIEKKPRTTVKITKLGQQQFLLYREQMKTLLE